MSAGAWMMMVVGAVVVGTLALILFATVRSIRNERTAHRSVWREFGLGLAFLVLFFTTWGAHAITEWQVFTDEELAHGQKPKIGDFLSQFGKGTLENWQSEFLQLFSFVVMSALLIHKGSAESKDGEQNIAASLRRIEEKLGTLPDTAPSEDGEENISASLRRIEEKLGTLPATAPMGEGQDWKLPDTPLEVADRMEQRARSKA